MIFYDYFSRPGTMYRAGFKCIPFLVFLFYNVAVSNQGGIIVLHKKKVEKK